MRLHFLGLEQEISNELYWKADQARDVVRIESVIVWFDGSARLAGVVAKSAVKRVDRVERQADGAAGNAGSRETGIRSFAADRRRE